MMSFITSIPSQIQGVFSDAGSWLTDAGRRIIDGFVDGIRGAFDRVRSTLSDLTSMLPDWKGPPEKDSVILKPAGRLIMSGFKSSLESQYGAIEASLRGFTADLASTNTPAIDVGATASTTSTTGALGAKTAPMAGATIENNFYATSHDPEVAARYFAQQQRALMGVMG